MAVKPGGTVRASVPLSAQEKQYVSEAGNAAPDHAVAVFAAPPNFDPGKSQPVLVCLSTSDFQRKNRDDLEDFYKKAAFLEGWAVLAGDGENNPGHDTAGWRAGMTLAAIDAIASQFSEFQKLADRGRRFFRRRKTRGESRAVALSGR